MQFIDRANLGEGFSKCFRVDAALDEDLKNEVFQIRHSVYCEDLQFEPCGNGLEGQRMGI